MTDQCIDLLSAALRYAVQGLHVFPCTVHKRPMTAHGHHDATTDPDIIRAMFSRPGVAGIGIPTGPASGWLVIDRDRHGDVDGIAACKALEQELGALPATRQQRTGSGGDQLIYRYPTDMQIPCSAGQIEQGVDIRGAGGYIVVPPSRNERGPYTWIRDIDPVDLPAPWLDRLVSRPRPDRTPCPPVQAPMSTPYGAAALARECETVAMTPEGQRNAALNRASHAIGQLVAGGEIEESEAIRALKAAAKACGLPEHEADRTIRSGYAAGLLEPRAAQAQPEHTPDVPIDDPSSTARNRFPRRPYPWHVLPDGIQEGLLQLARSCATSPSALPCQALCMVAAAVGRKFSVSPKSSWIEPIIIWFADIRDSGAGKTAIMHALARKIRDLQAEEHERADIAIREWEARPSKERAGEEPPARPRGYYTTSLTLEGLHADLYGHPTGGLVVLLSELSALISGQGEYKAGKGTDRESWLCLHDGQAARVTRKSGSVLIHDGRVQVCGGIQPAIFGRQFAGQGGTFLQDGTIFRLLVTYEPSNHYPLTAESWSLDHSEAWKQLLTRAFKWADDQKEPVKATLSADAQERFFGWRNDLDAMREDLPPQFRGYLPKAYGYALRLAGALHLLNRFSRDLDPGRVLHLPDIERGIAAVEYHLGQALDAMRLIDQPDAQAPAEVSQRTITLASVLGQLQDQTSNGKLAVGFIRERYNEQVPAAEQIANNKAFANILRASGLDIVPGVHDVNGRRAVTCMAWNDKTKKFLESFSGSLVSLQAQAGQGLAVAEKEKPFSGFSATGHGSENPVQRNQRNENDSLHSGDKAGHGSAEKPEKPEHFSGEPKIINLTDSDKIGAHPQDSTLPVPSDIHDALSTGGYQRGLTDWTPQSCRNFLDQLKEEWSEFRSHEDNNLAMPPSWPDNFKTAVRLIYAQATRVQEQYGRQ